MPSDDDREPLVSDPAITGGDLVLSPARLQDWLSEVLAVPCAVVLRRLRYKPGHSAVLAFDLTAVTDGAVSTNACTAWAYAPAARAKLVKSHPTTSPAGVLVQDRRRHVLVTTLAGDRSLPLLPRLVDPDRASRALGQLVPALGDHGVPRLRTVRHDPGRRWIGLLETDGQPPLAIRAFDSSGRTARAASGYRALGRAAAPTPRLVARSQALSALAVVWAEGEELALTDGAEHWRACGRALADLHDSSSSGLSRPGAAAEASAVLRAGRDVAEILPELRSDVMDLAVTTARLLERRGSGDGTGGVAVHGDLSAPKVVMDPTGWPTFIDLDAAHHGSPAYDLGSMTASTLVAAADHDAPLEVDPLLDAFLAGYTDVRPAPDPGETAVHAAAFRLRMALDPLRACDPSWRRRVTARVTAARRELAMLSPARSAT